MGATKSGEEAVRYITQNSTGTYSVSLPIRLIRNISWRKGQKVTIRQQGQKLIIEDWKE